MRMPPPPGKKLVRDWVGLRVRARRPLRNGYVTAGEGAEGKVTYALGGLDIDFDACSHCGIAPRITGVHPRDVDVVEPDRPLEPNDD